MNNPISIESIKTFMLTSLAEIIGEDLEDISAADSLVNDLDVDSLDLAELIYKTERKFNLELPKKNVLEIASEYTGDPKRFVDAGKLTEEGAFVLLNSMSKFDESQVSVGMYPANLFSTSTLQNWINMTYEMFNYLPAECPECQHTKAVESGAGKAVCGACQSVLRPLAGNDALLSHVKMLLAKNELAEAI